MQFDKHKHSSFHYLLIQLILWGKYMTENPLHTCFTCIIFNIKKNQFLILNEKSLILQVSTL